MRFNPVTWFTLRSAAGLSCAVALSLAGILAHASADPETRGQTMRAAAVVNDIVISSYDLDQRTKLAMITSGQQPSADLARRLHDQILRQLVDEMLQLLEAQKYKIQVTPEDIEGALKRIGQQNNIGAAAINKMLDDNGIARATLQTQLKADIAWQKLVQQRLAPRVTVSEEEIDSVMARTQESASSNQYLAAEIFVAVESPDQEAQAKESIQNIRNQLAQGASFAAMARQFSKKSTASGGGDMGWITDADVTPEVAKALQQMHPGTVSEPIRSAGGYYLIGMREKRTAAGSRPEATPVAAPPAAAADAKPMSSRITLSTIQIPVDAGASKAKQEKVRQIAIRLYQSVNGCGNLAALAKAEGATTVALGPVNVKDLAVDFRKLLEKTPNGRATPPLRAATGVQMFVVCAGGMIPGRAAVAAAPAGSIKPFQMPTRDEIQQRLYGQELSMMARRYLRDLRRDASIDIRDN